MSTVETCEVGSQLNELLARVARGEAFTLVEQGRAVARLTPVDPMRPDEDVRRTIEDLKVFSRGNVLGEGLTIRDLIE